MTITQGLYLSAALAFATLPVPFIWLEIGPKGYEYYGPNVPDIFILGATVLGKDRSFIPINLAYKFQLIVILYFALSCLWAARYAAPKALSRVTAANFIILLFFPLWIWLYTSTVIHNSDGAAADLTIHLQPGLSIYLALLIVTFILMKRSLNILKNEPHRR